MIIINIPEVCESRILYNRYRNSQNLKPNSNRERSERYLNNKSENGRIIVNTNMAYRLAKQDEEIEKANNSWWKSLRLLQ